LILDAIYTTALNDQVTFLHAGRGVKTPPVAMKPRQIITPEQFDKFHLALSDDAMRLLVETGIETGLRGELTELRPRDLDGDTCILVVSRAVVEVNPQFHPEGRRFLVKKYPKDGEWRRLKVSAQLVGKIDDHIGSRLLDPDDLLFQLPQPTESRRRGRPAVLPDPATLGRTAPDSRGRTYQHGTTSAYSAGRCRCQNCRDAIAAYRASRRASGKDNPRKPRPVDTDGHIGRDWFRRHVWVKAVAAAKLDIQITPPGCATHMPPGCSPAAPTSKSSRNGWATGASVPPSDTCTHCPTRTARPSTRSRVSAIAPAISPERRTG